MPNNLRKRILTGDESGGLDSQGGNSDTKPKDDSGFCICKGFVVPEALLFWLDHLCLLKDSC